MQVSWSVVDSRREIVSLFGDCGQMKRKRTTPHGGTFFFKMKQLNIIYLKVQSAGCAPPFDVCKKNLGNHARLSIGLWRTHARFLQTQKQRVAVSLSSHSGERESRASTNVKHTSPSTPRRLLASTHSHTNAQRTSARRETYALVTHFVCPLLDFRIRLFSHRMSSLFCACERCRH